MGSSYSIVKTDRNTNNQRYSEDSQESEAISNYTNAEATIGYQWAEVIPIDNTSKLPV